jgi:hypothetical protein
MNRINQPDRISVDSFMDTSTATNGTYFTFVNHAPNTHAIGAKRVHMLRATIPNIQLPIPDYSLVFYYYKLPTATTVPAAQYLKAVRLYPSTYLAPTGFTAYTKNDFVQTPQDLVDLLNAAAGVNGDSVTYNTLWTASDVIFFFDPESNQISWTGTAGASFYANAGYNDPIVRASQASTAIVTYNQDTTTSQQPFVTGYTLNLRTGFAMDGVNRPRGSGTNFLANSCANTAGRPFAGTVEIVADSYPNLTYTGNIYVFSNIVANSGFASTSKRNLLAVIPVDVPAGGIIQYIGHSSPAYALKVASEIYSIDIEMRDDANQPFLLPDSANVNIELSILYD